MKSAIQSLFNFDLVKSADEFVKALNKVDSKRADFSRVKKKTTFAPSGLGYGKGRCPRFWYYAFEGVYWEDKNNYRSIRNMENGIDRHTRFEALMNEMDAEILIANEEEVLSDDPPVRGFIDSQIQWQGKRWIVEFKTKPTSKFRKLRAAGKPPLYNVIQMLVYMHIKRFKYGMLVYEDKDKHDMYAVPIAMEGSIKDYTKDLVAWMNEVYETVTGDDKQLPKRAFTEKSKECKYCPVKKICWDDEEGEVEIRRQPELRI